MKIYKLAFFFSFTVSASFESVLKPKEIKGKET